MKLFGISHLLSKSLYPHHLIRGVMDRIAWLRAKADTDLGWLAVFTLSILSALITILSVLGGEGVVHVSNLQINLLLVAAAINTGITLITVYWGYNQKRKKDTIARKCENRELELLIQPLFLAFDKYPEDPKIMEREKFGLAMKWSLMSHPADKSTIYLHTEKADPVISSMQQYGNLAQPELRGSIREFLKFRQVQKESRFSSSDPYFKATAEKVDKIRDLVTARYNELMWSKKED